MEKMEAVALQLSHWTIFGFHRLIGLFFCSPTVIVDGLKRGFNVVRWLDANAVARRWGRRVFLFFIYFTLRLERHLAYTSRVETYSTTKASWHSPTEIIFAKTAKVEFECSTDALISFFKLALERLKLANKIFVWNKPLPAALDATADPPSKQKHSFT